MNCFSNICPEELIVLASALSIAIAKDLSAEELDALGNFFSTLGQNLSTIATQRALNEASCQNNTTNEVVI